MEICGTAVSTADEGATVQSGDCNQLVYIMMQVESATSD
jgi:hypothetical protein